MMYSTIRPITPLKTSPTPHAGGSFDGATAALGYTSGGNRSKARLVSFGATTHRIWVNDRLIDDLIGNQSDEQSMGNRFIVIGNQVSGGRYQTNGINGQREGRHGHSASVFRKD